MAVRASMWLRPIWMVAAIAGMTAIAPGCTCSGKGGGGSGAVASASAVPSASVSASVRSSAEAGASAAAASLAGGSSEMVSSDDGGALLAFSAPIAEVRNHGEDVVAALVASRGVVQLLGVSGGHTRWSADALSGVAWAPDADITLQAAPDGLALVWRGLRNGKLGRTLVLLGPHGEPKGDPVDVGAAFCVTNAGVAWIAQSGTHAGEARIDAGASGSRGGSGGPARPMGPAGVMVRGWSEAAARAVGSVPSDRVPGLACGDHDVIVLGDGDDDLTAATITPGDAALHAPTLAVRASDFGDDDEREHDVYTVGDDLGIVRFASEGGVAWREVPRGGTPGSWHRLKHIVPPDDDIVAVDGDADATVIVYTHDAESACPGVGSTAVAVRALRVGRKGGDESVIDLAPPDCDRSPGPFWVASTPSGQAVGWIDRRAKAATGPAIAGASVRRVGAGGGPLRRIEQPADAFEDGGCDEQGCSLAALLRPEGADGMSPEALSVIAYP